MSKIKLCINCKNNRKTDDVFESGYVSWVADNNYVCPLCQKKLIDISLTDEEDIILLQISRSATFFDAMIELKEKDPIEFQLKMSQFRNQVKQQEAVAKVVEQQNTPHCPMCNSTNIRKISGTAKVAGAAMFGLFSKTARSQFKCENCGYKW